MFETMKALVIKKNFESHYQRYFPTEKNLLSTDRARTLERSEMPPSHNDKCCIASHYATNESSGDNG